MVRTLDDALKLVREQGALSLTTNGRLPSLVESVTGERLKASWWSHPRGALIYELASALDDHPEALSVRLVRGKVTFLHARLWPSLLRVVQDEGWRTERLNRCTAEARTLLEQVGEAGALRFDALTAGLGPTSKKRLSRDREALEAALLLLSHQIHTEKGRHATVLTSWERWRTDRGVKPSRASLQRAMAELTAACAGEPIGV